MSRIKVEGYTDLERERESAIVNTNRIEYVQFMTKYRNKQAEKQKVATLCDEINTLKDEMNEIKNMLIKVLEIKWQ